MPDFSIRSISLLSILFVFGVQCSQESTSPETLTLHFQETLQLGTDENKAPEHEIFRMVSRVVVDERGWLYVADTGETSIRIYDENGEFQKMIGQEGSGPGEFEFISSLFIDSNDRLLVVDPNNARITAFTLDGNLISTWELPSITVVHQVAELTDGRFALVGQYRDQLVHVVDSDFSRIKSSFVHIDDLLKTNTREERVFLQFALPGSVSVLPDNSILYAPTIYDGELYVYTDNDGGVWGLSKTIEGYNRHRIPASITPIEQADRADFPLTLAGEGRYAIQFHSFSQRSFLLDNDRLIHFSIQETDGEELELLSELFDLDGTFIGTVSLDRMTEQEISVLNLDSNGNLYLSDRRDFPKLRRLAIAE